MQEISHLLHSQSVIVRNVLAPVGEPNMDGHGLYFVGYASMATISCLIIAWAQYSRKKSEGIPINYTVLKVIFGVALAMWAGAAMANFAYTQTTTATAAAGFSVGVILSIFFAWQLKAVVRKLDADAIALKELATRDSLTDLWNLRVFHETLKLELARAIRFGHPLSLMLLDIDNFKQVNEDHGHLAGDMILRELGRRLLVTARTIDCVARYGGEEISLILPATNIASAEQFAERIYREVLKPPFDIGNGSVEISASFGIAAVCEKIQSDSKLLMAANTALNTAKESGRNRICAYQAAA